MQSSELDLLAGRQDRITRIDTPDGPVWIENTLSFDLVKKLPTYPFSQVLADLLCEAVATGSSLTKACKEFNLPYNIIKRWERANPDFSDALAQARLDRADSHHDKILEIAEEKADFKTEIEALKWSASIDNSNKYSAKTKISGDKDNPIGFIISTGIDRNIQPSTEEEWPTQKNQNEANPLIRDVPVLAAPVRTDDTIIPELKESHQASEILIPQGS